MSLAPLLDVQGLTAVFRTRRGVVSAVDGVSFSLEAGAVLGLVGESGCGKSVTALSLLGLLDAPGEVVAGRALFDGEDLLAMSPAALRRVRGRKVGMIFQDPMTSLNPVYTVGDQIIEAIQAHEDDTTGEEARARAVALLREMGLADAGTRVDAYPHQLSGGMRQRVMIAMALSSNPALLIADEPTTALDVTTQAQILALIRARQRDRGLAVLLITHDLGIVAQACDQVVVMYAGRVAEAGPTREVLASPAHPYTQALLRALPGTAEPGERLAAIEGAVPSLLDVGPGCRFSGRCPLAGPACAADPPAQPRGGEHRVYCHHAAPAVSAVRPAR